MWRQVLVRPRCLPGVLGHINPVHTKKYNGQPQGPHPTYFQPPPAAPRARASLLTSFLLGAVFIGVPLGAYAYATLGEPLFDEETMDEFQELNQQPLRQILSEALQTAVYDSRARFGPPEDPESVQSLLDSRAGFSLSPKAIGHTCQLPSNMPCEDAFSAGIYNFLGDPTKDWAMWSVFDGHAGPRTAEFLNAALLGALGEHLFRKNCMKRSDSEEDTDHVFKIIKDCFTELDHDIIQNAVRYTMTPDRSRAETLRQIGLALSGSCALIVLLDPVRSVLRVANVGDSRAVLGRWDTSAGKYVAQAMSVDHTGFNKIEVARLKKEHPGEDPVDLKTGRVHGIAVSRAFGDSRWKVSHDLSKAIHDKFWGPRPRPDGMILTPPYLTAEPDVMQTKVQTEGKHPDFLIMASDGLWDLMSNEDAVTCVEQWLAKYKADQFLTNRPTSVSLPEFMMYKQQMSKRPDSRSVPNADADEDTYFDEKEGVLKWRVSPKHFVVEDMNCGVHLIKNALGGSRRNLFCGIMSMTPPLSREVRDDITVTVVFFGDYPNAMQHVQNAD